MPASDRPLSYAGAGVDIAAGEALVRRIAPAAGATSRPGVLSGLGGFGALFDPAAAGHGGSLLVAATDGVGTKLALGIEAGRLAGLGIDLVAMCVNDLLCQGAEPLFFLDYFATGRLDVDQAAAVIEGVADGCRAAGCALIGGETAEMPGLYPPGEFDIAGFAVGAVARARLLPAGVAEGDVLLGLASSGLHSNGFSLVRAILARTGVALEAPAPFDHRPLGEVLCAPTRLYVAPLLPVLAQGGVHALAHITGGGITQNLPRVLPDGLGAEVDLSAWPLPALLRWLMREGGLERDEALGTFNCGIGMIAVVAPERAGAVAAALSEAGEVVHEIGRVTGGAGLRYHGAMG